jgi:RND superfamily putative drug exporter
VFRAAIKQVAERMHKAARYPVSVTVSADGHWALVSTTFTHQFAVTPLERAVAAAGTPRIDAVLVGGVPSSGSDLKRAEELSVPVTLLVLLLAFGAVVAALVPVLLAATAVLAVGLLYAICLIAMAESSELGGTQLRTAPVAYGLWAACEHAFLLAPPVFLPLGFALRRSSALSSRFSTGAVLLGCAAIVLGLVGLFYAGSQNAGAAGIAINVLLGLQAVWVIAAAVSLQRRTVPRDRAAEAGA